jgi:hypothetical protein
MVDAETILHACMPAQQLALLRVEDAAERVVLENYAAYMTNNDMASLT